MAAAKPGKSVKLTPSPRELVRAFEEAVQSLRGTERRKMFGYPAIFVNGNMFAGLFRDSMVLKLTEEDSARFLRLPGAGPFAPMAGRVMKNWVVVPRSQMGSGSELQEWLGRALAQGRSLLPKTGKRHPK